MARIDDTVLTVIGQVVGSIVDGSGWRLPSLTNRGLFTRTVITGLILARPGGLAFFPRRRTVGAGSLRVLLLPRRGALVSHRIGRQVRTTVVRTPAGRRVIRIEAVKPLPQLVEQFGGLAGATFAKGLVYSG